jgi:uncharacterized protein (DUF1800 family)
MWSKFAYGNDQLRQKMLWALMQIFVAGGDTPASRADYAPAYMEAPYKNAFGNFRTLLEDVSLTPAMALYLSHMSNYKENPSLGTLPDENYAREIMQLFSVGLWMLNLYGTFKRDANGERIPTYNQDDIRGMAKIFTGWSMPTCKNSNPSRYPNIYVCLNGAKLAWWADVRPLVAFPEIHSTSEKRIIGGKVIPAGQTAEKDLKDALDTIFNHPNVGPFIGKQLIQRFVTSNPSPSYVARVASAFNNNGQGVRGDLKAVLSAIFLDPEARDTAKALNDPNFGKLREPVVRWVNFLRAFTTQNPDGRSYYDFNRMITSLGQWPFKSPSVFNFYRPDFAPAGRIRNSGLVGPEFQITNDFTIATNHNEFEFWTSVSPSGWDHRNNYGWLANMLNNPTQLVNALDELLTFSRMPEANKKIIADGIAGLPSYLSNDKKVGFALRFFFNSPDFLIQK